MKLKKNYHYVNLYAIIIYTCKRLQIGGKILWIKNMSMNLMKAMKRCVNC